MEERGLGVWEEGLKLKLKKEPWKKKRSRQSLFGFSLSEVFAFSKTAFQALGEQAPYAVKALRPRRMNVQLFF